MDSDIQGVHAFADERVEQVPDGFVTIDELYEAYLEFTREEGYPAVHRRKIAKRVEEAIDFDVVGRARTVDGERKRGRAGMELTDD